MGTRWLFREGQKWVDEGIITDQQWIALQKKYQNSSLSAKNVLITIAFLCIGIGVISFVASQWSDIPELIRLFILVVSMTSAYGAGIWAHHREAHALCASFTILGLLLFGASIILIGQMYHLVAYNAMTFHLWATVALLCAALIRNIWCGIIGLILLVVGQIYTFDVFDELSVFALVTTVALGALCLRDDVRPQWIVAWTVCVLIHMGFLIDRFIPFSFIFVAIILLFTYGSFTPEGVARWIKRPLLLITCFSCILGIFGFSFLYRSDLYTSSHHFVYPIVLLGVWIVALACHCWRAYLVRVRTDWGAFVLLFLAPAHTIIDMTLTPYISMTSLFITHQIASFCILLSYGLYTLIRGAKMSSRRHYNWGTALCLIALTAGFFGFLFSVSGFTVRATLFISFGLFILIIALVLRRQSKHFLLDHPKNTLMEVER